ncbi:hypothetical protein Droror1_Dr00012715 [Drosera rotundifolia]
MGSSMLLPIGFHIVVRSLYSQKNSYTRRFKKQQWKHSVLFDMNAFAERLFHDASIFAMMILKLKLYFDLHLVEIALLSGRLLMMTNLILGAGRAMAMAIGIPGDMRIRAKRNMILQNLIVAIEPGQI